MASSSQGAIADGSDPAAAAALPVPADTFGGELATLTNQLNVWSARVEEGIAAVRGEILLIRGDLGKLAQGGATELTRIIVDFRAELDLRDATRNAQEEALKGELRQLVQSVQDKFLLVGQAMAALNQAQANAATAAATVPAGPQLDPWAASRATAAAVGTAAPAAPAGPPGVGPAPAAAPAWPGGPTPAAAPAWPTPFRVDRRDWGDHKRLDLDTRPDGYVAWRDRALGHLAKDRPDVRRLLLWSEQQGLPIGAPEEPAGAAQVGLDPANAEHVSYVLFEAIKSIVADSLLGRARACGDGRGLELWRKLHTEWRGSAPQVVAAKARRFQDPPRCTTMAQLWEALPAWELLGSEVALGGYVLPDWVRANALDKMVPEELLKTIIGRPELAGLSAKLAWVRSQMEHSRGVAQAAHFGTTPPGRRDRDVDMQVAALSPEAGAGDGSEASLLWHLQQECSRRAGAGDWDGVSVFSGALQALSKGKGKGGAKGAYGKGGGKGMFSGGKGIFGKGAANSFDGKGKGQEMGAVSFNGTCHHCQQYGHRRAQCPALDREMAGKAGKGGMNGGKGLFFTVPENDLALEQSEREPPQEEPEGDDSAWWLGSLCSLRHEGPGQLPQSAPRTSVPPPCPGRCSIRTENAFAALSEEELEEFGAWPELGTEAPPPPPAPCWTRAPTRHSQAERLNKAKKPIQLLMKESGGPVVCAVSREPADKKGRRLVEAVVDSGAEESVAPPGVFPGAVKPSAMSRAGGRYRAANGSRIPNLGQQAVRFEVDEGHACGIGFQIADVERPLLAASQLAAAGNRVTFDADGGTVENVASGKRFNLQRRGGVYVLRMWVAARLPQSVSDCPRQGR